MCRVGCILSDFRSVSGFGSIKSRCDLEHFPCKSVKRFLFQEVRQYQTDGARVLIPSKPDTLWQRVAFTRTHATRSNSLVSRLFVFISPKSSKPAPVSERRAPGTSGSKSNQNHRQKQRRNSRVSAKANGTRMTCASFSCH